MVWGDTHGLCQDKQGHIYVAHTVHKSSMRGEAIFVFDENGKFVRAFGETFRGGAHGLRLRREESAEFLYHCDVNHCRIVKTSLAGDEVWVQGYPRADPNYSQTPTAFKPTNVAFAPNGDFYVADGYGSSRILRFSREGKFLGEIAKPGSAHGELDCPHGLCVDSRGEAPVLVVADRGNHRIQTFTLNGKFQRAIKDDERMRWPCNFHIQDDWMVCPDLDSQVCILDRDFKVVCQLGDGKAENGEVGSRRGEPLSGFTPGKFVTPHDAIFLHNGDILVAEWLPIGRITLLRKTS
jgi:sugar lactone lactonase YvrE